MLDLGGKVAVVTGAGSGIGRGIAVELARGGASVVAADIEPARAEVTVGAIREAGGSAVACVCDVRDRGSLEAMVGETNRAFGRLDIVVANAGIARTGSILTMAESEWDEVIDVNLKGVFLTVQVSARELVRQNHGGRIITLASSAAERASAVLFAYCGTKAGVRMLTRCWAQDLAPYGITVNSIGPGWVETPILAPFASDPEAREALARSNPNGRIGTPEDIGHVARWLASDEAAHLTGSYTLIDGGMSDRPHDRNDRVADGYAATRDARTSLSGDELLARVDAAAEQQRAGMARLRQAHGLR